MEWVGMCRAFTGAIFATEEECRSHEKEHVHKRLVGLSETQVLEAIDRINPELADAIELLGSRIGHARLAAGERKRERRASEKPLAIEGPRAAEPPCDVEARDDQPDAEAA